MSATTKANQKSKLPVAVGNRAPGDRSLYYKNVGLFSDSFLDQLSKDSVDAEVRKNWDTEALPEFSAAYEWMRDTWKNLKDILPTLDEDPLRERWINHMLRLLGWEYEVEEKIKRWGKNERPDYALFTTLDRWKKAKGCKDLDAYLEHVTGICEAKDMGVNLDGSKLDKTNPGFQIITYLQVTGKEWGILTNGRYWRLYSLRSKSKYTTYFEINVEKFLTERDDKQFRFFFNFFRRDAFVKDSHTNQSFLDLVFENGEHYAREVETKLKDRAFHLVELIAKGFVGERKGLSESELQSIYEHSLYYLFRLMFILNCEARGLLQVDKQEHYYTASLRTLCIRIRQEFLANQAWSRLRNSYNHISELFELLKSGDPKIGIHGFGEEVFAAGDSEFYRKNPISDEMLNKVLLELAFAYDKYGELRFIDYKRLSADHLGSIFEGLLEYGLKYAAEALAVDKYKVVQWSQLNEKKKAKLKDSVIQKGQLYLSNSSGERKSTGSYYTPDYIVDHIVAQTIGPLCVGKSAEEILELRIVDPAMGSGHFLLGTVKFLHEKLMEALAKDEGSGGLGSRDLRWEILHNCVFGADINPVAVELAKFSLWMFTASAENRLENLSDQLVVGNSLVTSEIFEQKATNKIPKVTEDDITPVDWKELFSQVYDTIDPGFDAVVGNPPYISMLALDKAQHPGIKQHWKNHFKSASGAFDIFILFFELAFNLAKKNGRISFIVPNKFLAAEYAVEFRKVILDRVTFAELLDLSREKVWSASVYPIVPIFVNDKSKASFSTNVYRPKNSSLSSIELIAKVPRSTLEKMPDLIWSFMSQPGVNWLLKALEAPEVLENVSDICGASTVSEGSEYPTLIVDRGTAPSGNYAKFVVSGTSFRYYSTWGKAPVQYMGKRYKTPWIRLSDPMPDRRAEQARQKKIVMAKVALAPRGFIDTKGEYVGAYTTYIFEKAIPLAFIAGIVNSTLINFVFRSLYDALAMSGGYLRCQPPQVKRIPFPGLDLDKKADRDRVERMVKKVEKLTSLLAKSQPDLTNIKALENEIDDEVFKLYGFTTSEAAEVRAIVEAYGDTDRGGDPGDLDDAA
jgi:hypothetical protein